MCMTSWDWRVLEACVCVCVCLGWVTGGSDFIGYPVSPRGGAATHCPPSHVKTSLFTASLPFLTRTRDNIFIALIFLLSKILVETTTSNFCNLSNLV